MRLAAVLACLLFFRAHDAKALCVNLTFGNLPSLVTFVGSIGGYSVYDPVEHLQTASFQVRAEATGATCEYFVTLSAGQSNNFAQRKMSLGAKALNYNAYVNAGKSNIFKALPTATDSEVIRGSFPVAVGLTQTNTHQFFWTVKRQQIVPASAMRYVDGNLTLSLYSGLPLLNPTLVTTKTITFQARVESSVDLSLVESGRPFDIGSTTQLVDFGTLESGAQRSIDIVVRSNDGYSVTMQSENRQRMIHSRGAAVASTVIYDVTFNGGGIDLSSGGAVQIISSSGTTPATGTAFPVEFTVRALSGDEPAGKYSDIIFVEVVAN